MSESLGHYIDGQWLDGEGESFVSHDPATGEPCWIGHAATPERVDHAVTAARRAQPAWAALGVDDRTAVIERFKQQLESHRDELAETISIETGKPHWESLTEVAAMIGKIPLSIQAYHQRRPPTPTAIDLPSARGQMRYRPLGVLAVFGPFNFPGHVANGHIVPALLAGNSIVFKPSELTPLVAQQTIELWHDAGLPPGVINLVQGAGETGAALVNHDGHDGVLFTGSYRTAVTISRALADRPEKMLALELGGNNPLIVHGVGDYHAAAYHAVQSCFITAGQRCTCARRVIVPTGAGGDAFIDALAHMTQCIRIGRYSDEPEPFIGPVISEAAARKLLNDQQAMIDRGGEALLSMTRCDRAGSFVTPGIVDVTGAVDRPDEECFGPLAQIIRTADLDAAIDEANNTRFGLVAGLFSDDRAAFDHFAAHIRAGLINWNRPTTGASGRLPFGGVGRSGNHRPSGYFATDYCTDTVASLQVERMQYPDTPTPGIEA
ncbi:succinylglutamate-semialdehyde dehydrogenase [Planctomycetales bacterium ZRK34]|nr:succinylglutamate-semialdehyde dehydrogenase [Planctomycetales bacterium ZRK34]